MWTCHHVSSAALIAGFWEPELPPSRSDDFELTSYFVVIDARTEHVVANGYYPTDSIYVIDPATYTISATVVLPVSRPSGIFFEPYPVGIAVHPEGSWVYVVNIYGESESIGTVAVLDAETRVLTTSIPVGSVPFSVGQFIGPTISGSYLGTEARPEPLGRTDADAQWE